jgi:hypothetical protein
LRLDSPSLDFLSIVASDCMTVPPINSGNIIFQ